MAFPSETETTELAFSGPGINPYSGRGLTQTLEVDDASGNIRQTINGIYRDVSAAQFRKYRSTISCSPVMAPAFDGIWPGQILTVDCAIHLSYKTSGGSASRTVVSGSTYTYGDYTFYRPQLTMMVLPGSPSRSYDEYGAVNGWEIALVEVGEVVSA